MGKRSIVDLTEPEQTHLQVLTARGTVCARKLTRAPSCSKPRRAPLIPGSPRRSTSVSPPPNGRGPGAIESRRYPGSQPGGPRLLAAADWPAHWTMQLLADRLVALGVVPVISDETVRRTLKMGTQTLAEAAVVDSERRRVLLAPGRVVGPLR